MNLETILAAIGAATAVSSFFFWLLKRSIESKFKKVEQSIKSGIDEQSRRSAMVFDAYFNAMFSSAGLFHRLRTDVTKHQGALRQVMKQGSNKNIEHCKDTLNLLCEELEQLRDFSLRNTLVLTKDLRAARRRYEKKFATYQKDFLSWAAGVRNESPPDMNPFLKALHEFAEIMSQHEGQLHEIRDIIKSCV